jgi:hypothetical protein
MWYSTAGDKECVTVLLGTGNVLQYCCGGKSGTVMLGSGNEVRYSWGEEM